MELTEAEAELYDRQIRLWGLDSQKRLRCARILVIGVRGFGSEVVKNIVLAGVKSVTLLDGDNLTKEDVHSQLLAPHTAVGTNRAQASQQRAQALNPMVNVLVDTAPVQDLEDAYFKDFEVVCATDCPAEQLVRINNACRNAGVKFFCGHVWGMFGYTFADLQTHDFSEDVIQYRAPKHSVDGKAAKPEAVTTTVKKSITFVPLEAALNNVDWSHKKYALRLRRGFDPSYLITKLLLRFRSEYGRNPALENADENRLHSLRDTMLKECQLPADTIPDTHLENIFGEVSPACAVVGGVLGQEIIKAVSQKEPPHNNMFFFNPLKCLGLIEEYGY